MTPSSPSPRGYNIKISHPPHPITTSTNPSNPTPTPLQSTLNASDSPLDSPIQNRSPKHYLFDNIKSIVSQFFSDSIPLIPPLKDIPYWMRGVIYISSSNSSFYIIKSDCFNEILRVEDNKSGDILFYSQSNYKKKGGSSSYKLLEYFNSFQVSTLKRLLRYEQPEGYPCNCGCCPACCRRKSGYKTLKSTKSKHDSLSRQLSWLKEYEEQGDPHYSLQKRYLRYATRTHQKKWRKELQGRIEIIKKWKDNPAAGCEKIEKKLSRIPKKSLKDRGRTIPTPHYFASISLPKSLHFLFADVNEQWFCTNKELNVSARADPEIRSVINRLKKRLVDQKRQKERTKRKALEEYPEKEVQDKGINRISFTECLRSVFINCFLEEMHNGFPELILSSRSVVHPWGIKDYVPNIHSLISHLAVQEGVDIEHLPDDAPFTRIYLTKEALEKTYGTVLRVLLDVAVVLSRTWIKDESRNSREFRRWRRNLRALLKEDIEIPERCVDVQTRQPDELLCTLRYMLADQRGSINHIKYLPEKEQVDVKYRKQGSPTRTLSVFNFLRRIGGEDFRSGSLREIRSGLYRIKDRKGVCQQVLGIQQKTAIRKTAVCTMSVQ